MQVDDLVPVAVGCLNMIDEPAHEGRNDDARQVAAAGAFALVLEAMTEPLATRITGAIEIPTIGIGASPSCDGQILVMVH